MKKSINYINALPDFLAIQRLSFCWFISQGLSEELTLFSHMYDVDKDIEYTMFGEEYILVKSLCTVLIARKFDGNYQAKLIIPIEVRNKTINSIKHKNQFPFIAFPLMTTDTTFIINGCERIIVSQIIRSPGIYFERNKTQKIRNPFKRKLSSDLPRSGAFIPSGDTFLTEWNLGSSIPTFVYTQGYYRGEVVEKETFRDIYDSDLFDKEGNIIKCIPYWCNHNALVMINPSLSTLKNSEVLVPLCQFFKIYRIISQTVRMNSKVRLIQLFFKYFQLKQIRLDFGENLIFNYFNTLLKILIRYNIYQQKAKLKTNTKGLKDHTLKLSRIYNKGIIGSQNNTFLELNSQVFLILNPIRIKQLGWGWIKVAKSASVIFNFQKVRPKPHFSTDFKDLLKYMFLGSKPEPPIRHKHLKNKTQFLFFKKDYVIKTNYTKKYTEKALYTATLIPEYGSWIRFGFQKNTKINSYKYPVKNHEDEVMVQLDKISQKPILELLKEMGLTDLEIYQNLEHADFFYFDKPLLLNSKCFNQPFSRFRLNSNYFKNISKESRIFDSTYYRLGRIGRLKINEKLNLKISERLQTITYEDIFAILDKLIYLTITPTILDELDHLKNRRVRSVGELLQNIFRIGFQRLVRKLANPTNKVDSSPLLNFNIVNATLSEFFGSSQLSQYLDQTNPLSSLTHRRRISGLGPGGFDRGRISFAVRDIHPSHYGRICPIETPEGQNIGLVSSLTTCARVNNSGFLETPFWRVLNGKVIKTGQPIYLTAEIEDFYKIAPADIATNNENYLVRNYITVRYKQNFMSVSPYEVDFIAISTVQIVSIAASLIPFFEHDDANRALMGSNMQRQSVPLMLPQKPIVGTGLENQIAINSGLALTAQVEGIINSVTANKIVITDQKGKKSTYKLQKYLRSNQQTCINQRPIVWEGENVKSGQILTDGPAITNSELSLGQNVLVGYMPWQGYNFEDAILINERLVYDDIFTSIHIERYQIDIDGDSETPEYTTKDIPHLTSIEINHLNEDGIIKVGTFVNPGDILLGKVLSKNVLEQLPESKLLRAIFGTKAKGVKDTSYRMPDGKCGRIIETVRIHRSKKPNYPFKKIYIFIAQIRKIQVGDKIAGRHGNKGIVSRILPRQDMPFLPDGTPLDIILNPLGVPSRMNVGQLYECLLGLAGDKLNSRFKVLPFDEMYGPEISRILINKKLRQASISKNESWLFNPYAPGKMILIDGRTGTEFDNPVTVGNAYMLKLIHLVDDKMHARATGPYSLITQQPLRGKSNQGGQRFGEMEVWALEGFGAAFTLKELLTIKSDDMEGRTKTLGAIVKGQKLPKFGIPESFKVLLQELRSVGVDISTYKLEKFSSDKKYTYEIDTIQHSKSKTFFGVSDIDNIFFK